MWQPTEILIKTVSSILDLKLPNVAFTRKTHSREWSVRSAVIGQKLRCMDSPHRAD